MKVLDIENDKQKLKRLRNKIIRMRECKEKALLINNYRIYSHYVAIRCQDDSFLKKQDEFEACESYLKYMKTFFKDESDLYGAIDILGSIFDDIGRFNEVEGVNQYIEIDNYVDERLGFELIEDFFHELSPYIYKIYKEIMNGGINFLDLGNGYACDVAYYDYPKIVSYNNMKSYETYKSIVHEIGHGYHYVLNANSNNIYFDQIDVEMAPLFMETIFNMYVDMNLYGKDYGLNSLLRRQSLVGMTGRLQRLLVKSCVNQRISERAMFGELYFDKLSEHDIKLLEQAYGYEFVNRDDFFTFGMEVNSFKYSISNLVALKLVDIYLQDKKEGLRLLKDYIMLPPSVSLSEKLENYQTDSYKKINRKVYEHGRKIHRI